MTTELEIWAGLVTFVSLATWPLWTFKVAYYSFQKRKLTFLKL